MVHETQWLAINDLRTRVSSTCLFVCGLLCLSFPEGMVIWGQASFLLLFVWIEWSRCGIELAWRGIYWKNPLCELMKNCESQVFAQLIYTMQKISACVRSLRVISKQKTFEESLR